MKQIVQSPRSGRLELLEVPAPSPGPGQVLVRTCFSVVSPGTEKLALDFARKSLLAKARSRPDLVRQVTRKLRQEGPLAKAAVRGSFAGKYVERCGSRVERGTESGPFSGTAFLNEDKIRVQINAEDTRGKGIGEFSVIVTKA